MMFGHFFAILEKNTKPKSTSCESGTSLFLLGSQHVTDPPQARFSWRHSQLEHQQSLNRDHSK